MLVLINEKIKIKKMYLVFILLYRKGTEMWHQWCVCVRACVLARVFQNLVSFLVRHHFKATLCNSNPPKRPSFGQNLRQNHSNQFQWCAKYCKLQVQWLKKNTKMYPRWQQMQDKYVYIRPSSSPAASSFFFVGKKDGELRPCIDYLMHMPRFLWQWQCRGSSQGFGPKILSFFV